MIPSGRILEETGRVLSLIRPGEAAWSKWCRENLLEPLGRVLEGAARILADLAGSLWGTILLGVAVLAAVALLAALAVMLYRRGQESARARSEDRVASSGPRDLDPDGAERDAARLAGEGRFKEAVRSLYLATFLRLHRRSGRPFDPSLTPGENLRPFRREPWFPGLRSFVSGYVAASFGDSPLDGGSYAALAASRPPEAAA